MGTAVLVVKNVEYRYMYGWNIGKHMHSSVQMLALGRLTSVSIDSNIDCTHAVYPQGSMLLIFKKKN